MTSKRALLYGFTLVITFIIATLVIGHLWVFIILIVSAFIGILISSSNKEKGTTASEEKNKHKKTINNYDNDEAK